MQRIFQLLEREGFKATDFRCDNLDGTFSKDNMIFAIRNFSDREDLQRWGTYQDIINRKIYIKVDSSKKLDIHFILFISFKSGLQDLSMLCEIEKDPYYCRKIVIRKEHFEKDKLKLPFLSFDIQKTPVMNRAQTIKEFLDLITKNQNERTIAEKIFEMRDNKMIARLLMNFSQLRKLNDEDTKIRN